MKRKPHRPRVFAQVGEWLKPTDCKSVPPSEVRRFESFPVHHEFVSRLSIALVCYVALGVLTWATITDPKFRAGYIGLQHHKDNKIEFRNIMVKPLNN